MLMLFEHKSQPLLPASKFYFRLVKNFAIVFSLIASSLLVGAYGYHHFEQMTWVDSFFNASMILTGMGPACVLHSNASKLFVSCYALFAGIIFLTASAIVLTPIFHRIMHKFNTELD